MQDSHQQLLLWCNIQQCLLQHIDAQQTLHCEYSKRRATETYVKKH
jgi:hypothetical protein